jgi:hypothetical protein
LIDEFLVRISKFNGLTIADLQKFSSEQLEWLFPVILSVLQSKHNSSTEENMTLWSFFSQKCCSIPCIRYRYYYLSKGITLPDKTPLIPMDALQISSDTFFQDLYATWGNIQVGKTWEKLNLPHWMKGNGN